MRGRAHEVVRQLAAMLAARAAAHPSAPGSAKGLAAATTASPIIPTGWDAIDRTLAPASPRDFDSDALAHVGRGGLQRGAMHEWLCGEGPGANGRRWLPPHSLFIHLAWRAIEANDGGDSSGLIIWIGRRVWPQANAIRRSRKEFTTETRRHGEEFWILDFGFWSEQRRSSCSSRWNSNINSIRTSSPSVSPCLRGEPSPIPNPKSKIQNSSLLSRSIFIDPPDDASRLWAIDLALRSPAASVVIADGSKLKMAESRRLQLAAERGRALALLARPAWEGSKLSAAATRWRVRRAPSSSLAPRWIVELLRCKQLQGRSGLQVAGPFGVCGQFGGAGTWEVEYVSPGCVRLVADVVDRSGSPHEAEGAYSLSLA